MLQMNAINFTAIEHSVFQPHWK